MTESSTSTGSQAAGARWPGPGVSQWPGWLRPLGWSLALLGLALLLAWAGRLARTGLSLRAHLSQAQSLLAHPSEAGPAAACLLVRDMRQDIVVLRNEGGVLAGLAPVFAWLPRIGGDLRAAPQLLDFADGLSEAGDLGCVALGPALAPGKNPGSAPDGLPLERVLGAVASNLPALQRAAAATQRAGQAWAQVDAAGLSYSLASKAPLIDSVLPLLQAGLAGAALAPDLLGQDRPRTYLVMALNEDELRPGGGFISGAGEVQVQAGRVVSMTFQDSYQADDFSLPYPDPPDPLRRYMGVDLWVFRDSNWSPDFPTAVKQALTLYRPNHPVSIDGVIALDQHAVQALVGAVGPLAVPGAAEPVTGDNVLAYIRRVWGPADGNLSGDWWLKRKSFMGPLAAAALQRLQAGQVDWKALAQSGWQLLEGKHLLVYLNDPAGAALLAAQGWDGAMQPGPGDYLMVVDANVGYNKASGRIQEAFAYSVDLAAPAAPRATLTLSHTHTGVVPAPCVPESRYDPTYDQMMDRCYWDYLQVFVPKDSRLQDSTRIPVPADEIFSGAAESGRVSIAPVANGPWQVWGVLAVLAPGTAQTRSYTLTLPAGAVQWQGKDGLYALRVQKQPGAPPRPLNLRVRLPDQSTLLDATPAPGSRQNGWLVYQLTLDRDQDVHIRFRSKR